MIHLACDKKPETDAVTVGFSLYPNDNKWKWAWVRYRNGKWISYTSLVTIHVSHWADISNDIIESPLK